LIAVGVVSAVTGNIIGGIWYFLIGMFLRGAAKMSYQQVLVRRSLEGETVRRFMRANPVTAPPDISIATLVEDYVYRYHFKMFPVLDGDRLAGCIRTSEIRELPRETWPRHTVRDLLVELCEENSIAPDVDATAALSKMNQSGASRLMVVEHGELVGVITLKDLLQFLSLKVELEKR
jgi:predicted transcriptional regulator